MSESGLPSYAAMAREYAASLPAETESIDASALAWLLLAPLWPADLARGGFPVNREQIVSGSDVQELLDAALEDGLLECAPGEPPWRDTWYWVDGVRRARAVQQLLEDPQGGLELFTDELRRISARLEPTRDNELPPPLARFRALAAASTSAFGAQPTENMAALLDEKVLDALSVGRQNNDFACPEAQRWIEVAAPLAEIFGGALELAAERSRRRVELFERRGRDRRFLAKYTDRTELQRAFTDLLSDSANDSWALHYLGEGGMGKTMLIRHITGPLAEERRLVTSRIDFDHINPDYPSRAPGLLLVALAEDLKLCEDSSVVDELAKFDKTIEEAQLKVDESLASGSILDSDVESRLEEAEDRFVAALRRITAPSRVVLILDTCEELARIRANGELSDAVVRTFELLNRLHEKVPTLRVVFSGRRELASDGYGDWKGEPGLPSRPYLRRAVVKGFTHAEAELFFDKFDGGKRSFDAELRQLMRSLSLIGGHDESSKDALFNPFDLNLYAGWLSDPLVDAKTVHAGGKHHYVRERIIRPLNEWVRPFVPYLAKLGVFDRSLVQQLTLVADQDCDRALTEIVAQEWVQRAAAAQRQSAVGNRLPSTWTIEPNVARRMVEYFSEADEQQATWSRVNRDLLRILPELVLSRPLSELSVEYFVVAFELMSATPEAAYQWWRRLESKLVLERAWDWGRSIVSAIRAREWIQDSPMRAGDSTGLIRGMLAATDAAMQTKLGIEGSTLQAAWSSVLTRELQQAESSPAVTRLRYRAAAGVASSLRWFTSPMTEGYVSELEPLVSRVPAMPELSPLPGDASDVDLYATELGFIDNLVEILDQIEWREPVPPGLFDLIEKRVEALRPALVPWMAGFLDCRRARLAFLANQHLRGPRFAGAIINARYRPDRTEYLDWSAPANLPMRLLLEFTRMGRWNRDFMSSSALLDATIKEPLVDIDTERALSHLLRLEADAGLPDVPMQLYDRALEVAHELPTCDAHREAAPLFQTLLEMMADRGEGHLALEKADQVSQDSSIPLAMRRAAERVKVYIAARWRLTELGVARETSLTLSSSLDDRILLAAADAFDPRTTYSGRWVSTLAKLETEGLRPGDPRNPVEEAHVKFDGIEVLDKSRAAPTVPDVPPPTHFTFGRSVHGIAALLRGWALHQHSRPVLNCGPRLAASIALEEASLLALRAPETALRLLSFASEHFANRQDAIGSLLTAATRALALRRIGKPTAFGDTEQALRDFDDALSRCDRARKVTREVFDAKLLAASETDPAMSAISFWRPWSRRINFARSNQELTSIDLGDAALAPDLAAAVAAGGASPAMAMPGAAQYAGPAASQPGGSVEPPAPAARRLGIGKWLAESVTFVMTTAILYWLLSFVHTLKFRGDHGPPGVFGDWGPSWLPQASVIVLALLVAISVRMQSKPMIWSGSPVVKLGKTGVFIGAGIFGIAMIVVAFAYLFRGYDWILIKAGTEMTDAAKLVTFVGILAFVGLLPRMFKGVSKALSSAIRYRYAVYTANSSTAYFVRLTILVRWLPWLNLGPLETSLFDEDEHAASKPYAHLARPFDSPRPRLSRVPFRTIVRLLKPRIHTELRVPTMGAGLAWEAMLDMPGVQRMCRVLENPTHQRFSTPIKGAMKVVSTTGGRGAVTTREAWMLATRTASNRMMLLFEPSRSAIHAASSDVHVNVLHVVDEVRESSRGLTLEPGDGRQMFASEVARAFPNLRLVILQLPHRSSAHRSDHDRVEVSRARRLAAQLFEAGVPAVLVLPSLREEMAIVILRRIIAAIASFPRKTQAALLDAIEDSQREVGARLATEKPADSSQYDHALDLASQEVRYDFCLYCSPELVLTVEGSENQ